MNEKFRIFARRSADLMGSPIAFLAGLVLILVWLATGPMYGYSDTWQLVINTGTTIITFLMVFLLQNTQTRDTRTLQLKLDELLRAIREARTELVQLENLSDKELESLQEQFMRLGSKSKIKKPSDT